MQYHGGAWQKIVFVVLADKSLRVENVFECVVKLPQTPYVVRRTMLYTPSKFSMAFVLMNAEWHEQGQRESSLFLHRKCTQKIIPNDSATRICFDFVK